MENQESIRYTRCYCSAMILEGPIPTDMKHLDDHVYINTPFDFRQYTQAVKAQRWLILGLMLVAVATTFLTSKMQAPVYEASATIALNGSAAETFKLPTALNQIIGSDAFLTELITDADLDDTVAGLRPRIHAEIVNGAGLIIIRVQDSQKSRANLIADLVARQFMDTASELDAGQAVLMKKQKLARRELEKVEREMETAKAELAAWQNSNIPDELAKATHTNGVRETLSKLIEIRADLALAVPEDPPENQIIARPIKPVAPVPTNLIRNIMLSAVAALLFGISVSIVLQPRRAKDTPPLA